MHLYEFMFVLVCVRESKAVSFACSNANRSELMAKRNRDTCRLKKWKFDFLIVNRSETFIRLSWDSFSFCFLRFVCALCAISLNGLCHFYHTDDDEERKRSHLISLIFAVFSTKTFLFDFGAAIVHR